MLYKLLFIFLFSICVSYAADNKSLVDMVDNLRETAKSENNEYQAEVEKVYEAIKKADPEDVKIPSYDIFSEDQAKIMDIMNLPDTDIIKSAEESCVDPEKLGNYRIFILISAGVPEKTLKNYMADAVRLKDALLVLRGVIGSADYIKPTQDFITTISCGKKLADMKINDKCDVSRVDINPLLFRLFKVDKVPAVVYSNLSYTDLMIRANTGKPLSPEEYYILRGDSAVLYALEKFQEAGADTAAYVKVLKGSY